MTARGAHFCAPEKPLEEQRTHSKEEPTVRVRSILSSSDRPAGGPKRARKAE